jgi:hypothetical protein
MKKYSVENAVSIIRNLGPDDIQKVIDESEKIRTDKIHQVRLDGILKYFVNSNVVSNDSKRLDLIRIIEVKQSQIKQLEEELKKL